MELKWIRMQVWSRYGEDGQTKNLSQKSQVTIFLERRGRTFAITVRMNEEKDYWNLLQSPRQRKYAAMSNDRFSFLRRPVNKICIHSFKSILHKGSVSSGILFYPVFVMTGDGYPNPAVAPDSFFGSFESNPRTWQLFLQQKNYKWKNLRRKRKRWQSVPIKELRENTITYQFPTLHITSPHPSRSSPEFCNHQQTSYFK